MVITKNITDRCLLLQVKSAATKELFKPSGKLVQGALQSLQADTAAIVPNVDQLQRVAKRAREKLRPKHSSTVDFEVSSIVD